MAEEAQPKPEEVIVIEESKTQEPPAEPDGGDLPVTDSVEQALDQAEAELEAAIPQSASFKEESNVVADLPDPEKRALDELKQLVDAALKNNEFTPPQPLPPEENKAAAEETKTERVTLSNELIKVEEKNEEPKIEEVIVTPATDEVGTEVPVTPATEDEKREILPVPTAAEEIKDEVLTAPAAEEGEKKESLTAQLPAPAVAEETRKLAEDVRSGEVSGTPAEEAPALVLEGTGIEVPIATAVAEEKTVEAIEEPGGPAAERTPAKEVSGDEPVGAPVAEEFIWGVPLLGDEKSDTVLLKFLRAREFKVKEAFIMLKNTLLWRKSFGIESLLDEDLDLQEMNKFVFMHGNDKEGHPVCYNVFGEFQDKELYGKAFGDEEKRKKFMRWRLQMLEKGIRQQLDFTPGGVCTMVQVNDLKNSPLLAKRELRQTTNQALALLQDNYPEFVAKQVFINVPWWYVAYNRVIGPFLTQRTKSKFVFASTSKSADTLFKYIAPEQVPVQYGGLSKENDTDFTTSDAVTEITIRPSSKQAIEVPVTEPCLLVWELRVLGWEVTYGAEFVPNAVNSYTVIVQKARKFASTDEPVLTNSFKTGEPGKIVLTIDNNTSKKKKLLYRSMTKRTDLI